MADDNVWNEVHPVVADEIHRLRDVCRRQQDEIERLTKQRDEWQATAAGLLQDISNAEDEIERLREQNAILQNAVSEEGRANRMTRLYEKAIEENIRLSNIIVAMPCSCLPNGTVCYRCEELNSA